MNELPLLVEHEQASLAMFDHLIDENKSELGKDWQVLSNNKVFIKELIVGRQRMGQYKKKSFLYDIVANKTNEIDVDKFDYFARDCHHLGIKNNFDHNRFIKFARVFKVDGEEQICTRDKEVGNLYDFFHTRNSLHRRAYQHKVTNIVETMITEAFVLADKHLTFKGKVDEFTLSTAIDDMVAYTKLTDNVFEQILFPNSTELDEARVNNELDEAVKKKDLDKAVKKKDLDKASEILREILSRRLYKCVGQFYSAYPADIKDMRLHLLDDQKNPLAIKLLPQHLKIIKMDYGMKTENPIDHVRFYRKGDKEAFKISRGQVSTLIPRHFQEWLLQVYCTAETDEKILATARKEFLPWCQTWTSKKQVPTPIPGKFKEWFLQVYDGTTETDDEKTQTMAMRDFYELWLKTLTSEEKRALLQM